MHQSFVRIAIAAVAAIGASSPSFAATPIGDYLSVSGFGTVGAMRTNSDEAEFKQSSQGAGASRDTSINVDSDFGLQLTATATPWLSGTIQMLSIERDKKHLTNEVEWAYVKVKPVDGLTLRGGRMALPTFAVSDSRNVGYANTWLRAPGEVYALAGLQRMEGGDATYAASLGSTTLTVSALAGKGDVPVANAAALKADKLRGVNILWETEWATFRISQIRADVHIDQLGIVDGYRFTGAGVIVDRDNIVAQAEYVMRHSEKQSSVVDSNGWYLLGGYRFGSLLPYASYAASRPRYSEAVFHVSGPQKTAALGLRWDAFKSADIKFQVEHIDTDGTAGVSFLAPVGKSVTGASVAVDFVF